MKKKLIKRLGIASLLVVGVLAVGLHTNIIKLPIERGIYLSYVADFSDNRVLVGASHNVFVAKVLEQSGTKDTGIGPETQFEVQVVFNIKGNLSGKVTVDQEGGYKNGVLYLVYEGDAVFPSTQQGDALLKPGSTYLFTSRYDEKENWYTLISHPNGRKLISRDANLSTTQLLTLAQNDEKVIALQAAYINEILLDADIKNNNTRNSYQSL